MVKSSTLAFNVEAKALIPTELLIREFPLSIILGNDWWARFQLVNAETAKGISGKRVTIQIVRPDGGGITDYKTTDAYGMVTITIPGSWITQEGDYEFYGEFAGDADYAGCDEEDSEIGVLVVC